MPNYWETRTIQNRNKAIKLASSYSVRERKLFSQSYKTIVNALNDVLVDGTKDMTRTELWNMKKYMDLRNVIENECNSLAYGQVHLVDETIEEAFKLTVGATMKDFKMKDNFNLITQRVREKVVNSNWSGKNYSDRVWTNRNALASKLQKGIEDYMLLGKSPTQIKKQLADDLKVGWKVADRLIRTETAHIYTAASLETFKEYGVQEVEYLNESAGCDECGKNHGKRFVLGTEPMLPIHPNCTCCYIPVVELKK